MNRTIGLFAVAIGLIFAFNSAVAGSAQAQVTYEPYHFGIFGGLADNPDNGGQAQILGGDAMAKNLFLGDNQGDSGSVTVDGASAVLDAGTSACRGDIYIGNRGKGNLTIVNGATVRNRYAYIAALQNPTRPNSNGYVNVASTGVQGYAWYLYDNDPQCTGAGLFIGCTPDSNGVGGNATVNLSDGSLIKIVNYGANPGLMVGFSGTLTGHGVIRMDPAQGTTVSKTVKVRGTLAPKGGALTIQGNLDLTSETNTANTVCNVTPQAWDNVQVTQATGGGLATLGGRLTVIMTGTFTPGMSFTLLHADGGRTNTFAFESIMFQGGGCISPVITYDANNVYLYLSPSCE